MSADAAERARALEPGRSFIVEAPAGSGKTELLIQRYLKLLARVERPEQIVAITFTRKAAGEVRQRILDILQLAADHEADVSLPAHRRISLGLAREVLVQAKRQGWSLVDQPRRFCVMTIDSLNFGLAQRMPLLANGIGGLEVADDVKALYAEAARRTTESLADESGLGLALTELLAAADNSIARLERWLADILPRRDRWLRELADPASGSLAGRLASNLSRLTADRLADLRNRVGPDDEAELVALLRELGVGSPGDGPADERTWRAAGPFLLTKDGGWRKRFTRKQGVPAGDKALAARLAAVCKALAAKAGVRERLAGLCALPAGQGGRASGELLAAIERVLPRLLAELRVLFQEGARVDHTEVALAALQALGAVDEPSELLLALDRRIEHLLVDEFQDTSHLQWRLLELLTAAWQPGDGRTLFLVGDPMQSIYRFRDADPLLFEKARQDGIGSVRLETLALKENHRSAAAIVEWVNARFTGIFSSYRAATARGPGDADAGVAVHVFRGQGHRAGIARVVEIAGREMAAHPGQSLGILVRSRTHLAGMRAALEEAGIRARAVEIDSPADTQLGQDLMGLTAALVHPGDRLAWLGVLRSPWCGLGFADLLALCEAAPERPIPESLGDAAVLERLSPDGRRRAAWLAERIERGVALRAARAFGGWVRDCWFLLDGPAALEGPAGLEQADRFFTELDVISRGGDIDDPADLRRHFAEPLAGTGGTAEGGIEIMTMHRAKGLEFDTVILPGLSRVPRGSHLNLLTLQEFYLNSGEPLSLFAGASRPPDPMLEYLAATEREHEAAERGRLLYVAATRAKQRLHLIGSVDGRRGLPAAGSLLATLWPALEDPASIEPPGPGDSRDRVDAGDTGTAGAAGDSGDAGRPEAVSWVTPRLRYLRADDAPLPELAQAAEAGPPRPEFEWVHPASVQVGTLIHRELERLAEAARRAGEPVAPAIDTRRFGRELALLGVEPPDLDAAAARVTEALEAAWADATGRWILKPWPESWSELRLTVLAGDRLEHVQLDRSFVDAEGNRWIIDYKTGRHLGSDIEGFLAAEVERYRAQLTRYAGALAAIDSRPIRIGLYFPLMQRLRELGPGA